MRVCADYSRGMERRAVLTSGAVIAGAGIAAVTLAACSDGGSASTSAGAATAAATPAGSVGTGKIANASDVPVGSVFAFQDPQGGPAFLLQPAAGTFLAYSGICTHNGCTVGYDGPSGQFACPCHGARFDAATGAVVQGPAQQPLAKIAVAESGGVISYA